MNNNEIHLNLNKSFDDIDKNIKYRMMFIYNALNDGWTITKNSNNYIFKKKHLGKKEIFEDSYLTKFINDNMNIDNI